MTWRLRRSVGFGPVRVNLSGRGIGYSIGVPGLRVGVRSTGRRYRTTSVPGTGLYETKDLRAGRGCALAMLGPVGQLLLRLGATGGTS